MRSKLTFRFNGTHNRYALAQAVGGLVLRGQKNRNSDRRCGRHVCGAFLRKRTPFSPCGEEEGEERTKKWFAHLASSNGSCGGKLTRAKKGKVYVSSPRGRLGGRMPPWSDIQADSGGRQGIIEVRQSI